VLVDDTLQILDLVILLAQLITQLFHSLSGLLGILVQVVDFLPLLQNFSSLSLQINF